MARQNYGLLTVPSFVGINLGYRTGVLTSSETFADLRSLQLSKNFFRASDECVNGG